MFGIKSKRMQVGLEGVLEGPIASISGILELCFLEICWHLQEAEGYVVKPIEANFSVRSVTRLEIPTSA